MTTTESTYSSGAAEESHAVCPVCTRIVTRDGHDEAASIVESHNEQRHDGEQVAHVVGDTDDLNKFMDHAREEYGSAYSDLVKAVLESDAWEFSQ